MSHTSEDALTLDALNVEVATLLAAIPNNQDEQLDLLLEELQNKLIRRKTLIVQILDTDLGLDPAWVKTQLADSKQLEVQARAHLAAHKHRMGGLKRGRQQVNQYQQIEANR